MSGRYSRQVLFDKIGEEGQKKIGKTTIAIVGCGALGSNSAEIMSRAGVRKIIIIDFDKVAFSNLQRQSLYTEKDLTKPKVEMLRKHLKDLNSKTIIEIHDKKLDKDNLEILNSDIIIDGTDNFETRFLINEYAVENNIPYIFGSTIKAQGMIYPIIEGFPCLKCVFDKKIDTGKSSQEGIIASAAKTTSSIQCAQALKLIVEETLEPEMIKFDLWENEFNKIKTKKNKSCKVCK